MAIDWRPGLLGQEFNKTYADFVNCKLVPPPYYEGRVPQAFYMKKRDGFVSKNDFGFDEIYDQEIIGNDIYTIGTQGGDVCVTKNEDILYQELKIDGRNYKFLYMGHVQGNEEDTGTDIDGIIGNVNNNYSQGEQVLVDKTKSWTVNQYAGHYVYLTSNIGAGEVFRIDSNTATELYISNANFIVLPQKGENTDYAIYPTYGDTLCFVGTDGVYCIHDFLVSSVPDNIGKMPRIENPIDIICTKERLFWINVDYTVFASQEGVTLKGYFTGDSIIGNSFNAYNIMLYQDYVLLLGPNFIDIVRETKYQVGSSSQLRSKFDVVNVSKTHGIFCPNAFHVYNQGLYIFTQNNRFMAITISPAGTDRFYVSEETDQGIYVQKFFDNFVRASTQTINIKIDDRNIYITYCNGQDSEIYIFEMQYQGWHRWKTTRKIRGKKYDWYGDIYYELDNEAAKDEGEEGFEQHIKYIMGEGDITCVKRHILEKLIIGGGTTRTTKIQFSYHLGGLVERHEKTFEQAGYLIKLEAFDPTGTQGTTIVGYQPGISTTDAISLYYSGQTDIEIPTGFFHELCIIELIGGVDDVIVFGGYYSGHEISLPQVTTQVNVI